MANARLWPESRRSRQFISARAVHHRPVSAMCPWRGFESRDSLHYFPSFHLFPHALAAGVLFTPHIRSGNLDIVFADFSRKFVSAHMNDDPGAGTNRVDEGSVRPLSQCHSDNAATMTHQPESIEDIRQTHVARRIGVNIAYPNAGSIWKRGSDEPPPIWAGLRSTLSLTDRLKARATNSILRQWAQS